MSNNTKTRHTRTLVTLDYGGRFVVTDEPVHRLNALAAKGFDYPVSGDSMAPIIRSHSHMRPPNIWQRNAN